MAIESITSNDDGETRSDFNRKLKIIQNKISMMTNLVNGILQYSNISYKKENPEVINLYEIIDEVIGVLSPPNSFKIEIKSELPNIKFDRFRLFQLFQNLISNAIKYNNKPNGNLVITTERLLSGDYEFKFSDNGIGINTHKFSSIFQLFETGQVVKSPESTGIGLSIVKKIVNLLDGNIKVESKLDEGSTFIFTISKQFIALS